MDSFNIIQDRIDEYLKGLGNIYLVGINNINDVKRKLDSFARDFDDL